MKASRVSQSNTILCSRQKWFCHQFLITFILLANFPVLSVFGQNSTEILINASKTTEEPFPTPETMSPTIVGNASSSDANSTMLHRLENKIAMAPVENASRPTHFEMITLNWKHVEGPYTVSCWLLLASIAKIIFHVNKRFADAIPDSALLIVLGLILGYGLQQLKIDGEIFTLKSACFFLYLLPPIIFDAGYFMPNRQLFENFDSVLLFAFVGTIWNTLAIGTTLLVLGQYHMFSIDFTAFEILLFASLISAVDPVAVIAVFEEIHINEFLFINVFGEALFNDGVSVVLYQMFRKFTLIGRTHLHIMDYISGALSFLVIAIGGILIGIAFSFIACIATRFTQRVKILAPVFIFVVPYLSYLTAEMFGLSSILAIVACGIKMKQYVKGNITHDANNSVKYFIKMMAQCSETIIFMFLGLSTITSKHHWDTWFLVSTIALCLIYRTIGVVFQCAVLNRFRKKKFTFTDQFVLSYGGLRGAIAFGLVVSLPNGIPAKQMFVTTCIAVIFFTVFLQGITIRPLLYLLKVEKSDEHEEKMIEKVFSRYCDYTMAAIEDIAGQKGHNYIRDAFERFNSKILKPILMRNERWKTYDASPIVRAYTKITLQEAMKLAQSTTKLTKGGTHRVSSMLSPSSATTTIGSAYGMAWAMNGGGPTDGAGIGSRPETPSPLSVPALEKYLATQENTEELYAMFSRLLDRKLQELRSRAESRRSSSDDIKDDYMEILSTREENELAKEANKRLTLGDRFTRRRATISVEVPPSHRGNGNMNSSGTPRQWSQPLHIPARRNRSKSRDNSNQNQESSA